jgi:hypothetical protein
MNSQKIMRVLFLLVPVLLLLSIFWHAFAPFLSLALLYLMLLVIRSGFVQALLGKRQDPPVYYQPPQQSGEASAGGSGFGLTPPEYYPSSATHPTEDPAYERGYQAQPSWIPGSIYAEAQPKDEYERPQAFYPEMPEMELPPQ